jgi:hypothetical protein
MPPRQRSSGVGRPPTAARVPSAVVTRPAEAKAEAETEVGQRLTAAEPRPERDVGSGGSAEPGRVAAVLAVRVRRGRDPPPRGPDVVIGQARTRRQPEQGERIIADRAVAAGVRSPPAP